MKTTKSAPREAGAAPVEGRALSPTALQNVNQADFTWLGDPHTVFDLNAYYTSFGVAADVTIKEPGAVKVPDRMTTKLPLACRKVTLGFSIFHTLDDVDALILASMQAAAAEAGVELLTHDAGYNQDLQNKAVEDWIAAGVAGVILAPCDFTAVKTALDALAAAKIPVVALNAPLAGTLNAAVISDCVEQGKIAGELLEQALLAGGKPMQGEIVYQTLPFVHPNAVTRARGFRDVFAKYAGIRIIELTGITPEDHYKAFDAALKANPALLGAWGLYSSATLGMMDARQANASRIPLVSVDNDRPILTAIEQGQVLGTAAYAAFAPARWCISEMVNLLNGAPIPGIVFYENRKVTQENVAEALAHYYPARL